MNLTARNPYIGPRIFQRNEGHLFFGREREANDLIGLVAYERLVLFYAQSGAGKSSIINTRLIPSLEAKGYEVLPVGRVGGDSNSGVKDDNVFVHNLLRSLVQREVNEGILAKLSLAQFLTGLSMDDKGYYYDATLEAESSAAVEKSIALKPRVLIIDQFEELLSTHTEAWEKRDDFFFQLSQAMEKNPQLRLILVMREDYIAALDPFAYILPGGLRVRYYMQRLEREAALVAIKKPVEELRPYAEGVAQKLVDDLCSIKVIKPDGTLDSIPGQYVEPVQLQVVCYSLWENLAPNGEQITERDLENVGDVNQSLGRYYDGRVDAVAQSKQVNERTIREWFGTRLISLGGVRNIVLQEISKRDQGLDDDVIQAFLGDLVRAELRGGAVFYELSHDRLVEPILWSNERWFEEHLSALQRQAAIWQDHNQNESWLLNDQALEEVETWARDHPDELTYLEKEFLEACQKQRARLELADKLVAERSRRARQASIFYFATAFLLVLLFSFTIAIYNSPRNSQDSFSNVLIPISSSIVSFILGIIIGRYRTK